MKTLLPTIGLLLLTACGKPDLATSWGTHFIFDDAKTQAIHQDLSDCLTMAAILPSHVRAEELQLAVKACDRLYWSQVRIKDDPPTFYGVTGQTEDSDPYAPFGLCAHGLASPMWDFPEENPTESRRQQIADEYRTQIFGCLDNFPKQAQNESFIFPSLPRGPTAPPLIHSHRLLLFLLSP